MSRPEPLPYAASVAEGDLSSRRKILLIEGEADQAIYWDAVFRSLGFEVLKATTLREAEALLSAGPSIIACSSWTSDGAGMEFFGALRRRPELALVYLVLLTSGGDEVIASLRAGANDCIDMSAPYGEIRARLELADRVISLNEALQHKSAALSDALSLIQTELQSAAALQAAMLPKTLERDGFRIHTLYHPSELLGGDMIGVAPVDEERVAFGLIDVVGHGTASALISCSLIREMMDRIVALLQSANADIRQDCGRIAIEELNGRYCRLNLPGMYFTALAGVFDARRGIVRYCQAGNPNLLCFDPASGWRELQDSGFPVGLVDSAEYACREIELLPGQMLLAISDGLLRPQPDDPAGSLELTRALPASPSSPESVIDRLGKLAATARGRDRDDQSAMLISRARAVL
jgi:sigma-B regulation protein RsbU (phosphoserine phosphatase)